MTFFINPVVSSQMGFLSLSEYKGNCVLQGASGRFTNGSSAIMSSVKSGSTDWLWLKESINKRINKKASTFISDFIKMFIAESLSLWNGNHNCPKVPFEEVIRRSQANPEAVLVMSPRSPYPGELPGNPSR